MKHAHLFRTILCFSLCAFLFPVLSAQQWQTWPDFPHPQMGGILERWEAGIRSREPWAITRDYASDAVRILIASDGTRQRFEGREAIIASQERLQEDLDESALEIQANFRLPEVWFTEFPGRSIPAAVFEFSQHIGLFEFEERAGRLYVVREVQLSLIAEPFPADSFQGQIADGDENRRVEEFEQLLLADWYRRAAGRPHRVETVLDEYFDWDENGRLDDAETYRAGAVLFRDQIRFGIARLGPAIRDLINIDQDPYISFFEAENAWIQTRTDQFPAHIAVQEENSMADMNLDGFVSSFERELWGRLL